MSIHLPKAVVCAYSKTAKNLNADTATVSVRESLVKHGLVHKDGDYDYRPAEYLLERYTALLGQNDLRPSDKLWQSPKPE